MSKIRVEAATAEEDNEDCVCKSPEKAVNQAIAELTTTECLRSQLNVAIAKAAVLATLITTRDGMIAGLLHLGEQKSAKREIYAYIVENNDSVIAALEARAASETEKTH